MANLFLPTSPDDLKSFFASLESDDRYARFQIIDNYPNQPEIKEERIDPVDQVQMWALEAEGRGTNYGIPEVESGPLSVAPRA